MPVLAAPDTSVQTGPGFLGPLIPLDIPDGVILLSEFSDLYVQEDFVDYVGQFSVKNESNKVRRLDVGIPLLVVDGVDYSPKNVEVKFGSEPLGLKLKVGESIELPVDMSPYVTTTQKFSLKRAWYVTQLTLDPNQKQDITIKMRVDYLFMREVFRGRREESNKYFRYERSLLSLWEGSTPRSMVYVTPKVKDEWLDLIPLSNRADGEKWAYLIENRKLNKLDDLVIVYDPLDLRITEFGLGNWPRPRTLESYGPHKFSFENIVDGKLNTAWCEDEKLGGENYGFEVEWGKYKRVRYVEIFPGASSEEDVFKSFNRLKKAFILFSKPGWMSDPIVVDFEDKAKSKTIPIDALDESTMMVLQIREVYVGQKTDATCISDIRIKFKD